MNPHRGKLNRREYHLEGALVKGAFPKSSDANISGKDSVHYDR